jgi:hypothetical protein
MRGDEGTPMEVAMLRFLRSPISHYGLLNDDRGQVFELRHERPKSQRTEKRIKKIIQNYERKKLDGYPTHEYRMEKLHLPSKTSRSEIISVLLPPGLFVLVAYVFQAFGSGIAASVVIIVGISIGLFLWNQNVKVRSESLRLDMATDGHRPQSDENLIRESLGIFHRCPVCDSSFTDGWKEDGECFLCPECGGAWSRNWFGDGGVYSPPADAMVGQFFAFKSVPFAVEDGRGMLVPLLATQKKSKVLAQVRSMADRTDQRKERRIRKYISIGLLSIAVIYGYFFYRNMGNLLVSLLVSFIVLLVSFAIAVKLLGELKTRREKKVLATNMASQGICPCCEHQLRTTPSPTDGCLICDHCGSAWKQQRDQNGDPSRYHHSPSSAQSCGPAC